MFEIHIFKWLNYVSLKPECTKHNFQQKPFAEACSFPPSKGLASLREAGRMVPPFQPAVGWLEIPPNGGEKLREISQKIPCNSGLGSIVICVVFKKDVPGSQV